MPVSCTVCHQSFGRQEHLTRHMRIHTHEKPYRCSYCEKRFSRLDVLSRHKASHEEQSASPATPVSSRACKQCARDRVRCSRSLPCKRCSVRQLTCCYPAGCNTMPLNGDSERRSSQPMDMAESPNLIIDRSTTTTEPQDNNGDSTLPIADGSIAPATSGSVVDHADDRTIWGDVFDTFSNVYDHDLHGLGLSSINWISPGYQYETIWNPLSYPACEPPQMHSPDVQIADTTVEFTQSGGNHVSQPEHPGTSLSIDAHNRNEADDAATQQSIRGEYYVDGDGPRVPFRGRYHGRGSVSNGRRPLSPAAATSAEGAQSIHQSELCSQEAYNNLIQNCMQEAAHLESYTPIPQYPSHAQIELYVQRYFDEFDPILPFLRRASFREVDSMHWLLLLAVAITGSKYVCPPDDVPVELLAILETTLRRNRDSCENLSPQLSDNKSYGSGQKACNYASIDIHVLQAAILFFALHLRIGQTTGFNKVLRWRSYLVETCDSLGLLRHSDSDQSDGFQLSAGSSLQDWLQHESKIRTGMTIWFLDSTMMYEFGLRPLMALDDARANLPSCDDIWRTSTHTQKDNMNRPSLTLAEALEVLYIEKRLPAKLSEFSVGLVIHAIFRRTKTMLSQATRLDSWTPSATPQSRTNSESAAAHPSWLPSTSIASKWRNSACDALDILHWHANSKVAKSTGFEHHTILHLHLARIIILTPTDCIKALAVTLSTTFSEGNWSNYRAQIASARTELFQWAVRDRYKARLAVIHCASLYWHVRRYSCDSIHEPYAIYIATLVLWAFGVAAQLPEVSEVFGRDDGNEPDPSFCHLDRPLDDELVQLFVRVGHRMCPHLSRVGNIFLPGAASKILAVGVDLLGPNPQTPPAQTRTVDTMRRVTWGIEETYAQTLNALHGTAIRCSTATDTNSLEFPWNLASS